MVLPGYGANATAEPLHLSESASLAGRLVRDAAGDSEAGAARSEYAMPWTAGFVFKRQSFGGPGFKSVQIGLSNRCKHKRSFSCPGYLGQQWDDAHALAIGASLYNNINLLILRFGPSCPKEFFEGAKRLRILGCHDVGLSNNNSGRRKAS